MKIYVANLGAYNEGMLLGKWFDLEDFSDADELSAAIHKMLEKQRIAFGRDPYEWEEYAVHDYSESPSGSRESEWPNLEKLLEIQRKIEEHGLDVISAFFEAGLDETQLDDIHYGIYDSIEDFGYEYCEGIGDIPEWLEPYVDFEKLGKELLWEHYWTEDAGKVYVFWD